MFGGGGWVFVFCGVGGGMIFGSVYLIGLIWVFMDFFIFWDCYEV